MSFPRWANHEGFPEVAGDQLLGWNALAPAGMNRQGASRIGRSGTYDVEHSVGRAKVNAAGKCQANERE